MVIRKDERPVLDNIVWDKKWVIVSGHTFSASDDRKCVREVGTGTHWDPIHDDCFRYDSNGSRISALSYESFGTYPQNLKALSWWRECARFASRFLIGWNEVEFMSRWNELDDDGIKRALANIGEWKWIEVLFNDKV